MALSLVFAGVAVLLAEMGTEVQRAARLLGMPRTPRRAVRKVCAGCERQRAVFRHHGIVKWGPYHTLCRRCFRLQREALSTQHLAHSTALGATHLAPSTVTRVCTSS